MSIETSQIRFGVTPLPTENRSTETSVKRSSVEPAIRTSAPEVEIDLDDLMSELNRVARSYDKNLRFQVSRESGDVTVQIIDRETSEVLKELPAEETRDLRERVHEAIGVLVDANG